MCGRRAVPPAAAAGRGRRRSSDKRAVGPPPAPTLFSLSYTSSKPTCSSLASMLPAPRRPSGALLQGWAHPRSRACATCPGWHTVLPQHPPAAVDHGWEILTPTVVVQVALLRTMRAVPGVDQANLLGPVCATAATLRVREPGNSVRHKPEMTSPPACAQAHSC